MRLTSTPSIDPPAPSFELPATDGQTYRFEDLMTPKGLVVAFICNHCPYVVAIIERLVRDAKTLQGEGFGVVAISSNDPVNYPADSFENMALFAERHGFSFPYCFDESQEVARAYDAVCTPDLYGVSGEGIIQYRGRLDAGRVNAVSADTPRELVEAMRLIGETGKGPQEQHPSMGCSIKWRY